MKRLITSLIALLICSGAIAQNNPKEVKLKNSIDSVSYAIGVSVASSLKEGFGSDLDVKILASAIQDVLDNRAAMTNDDSQTIIHAYLKNRKQTIFEEKDRKSKEFFEKLQENKDIKFCESGIYYSIIEEGEGEIIKDGDTVIVNYELTRIDGEVIDSSEEPFEFKCTSSTLIAGFYQGILLARKGTVITLYIPYSLGYKEYGSGPIEPYEDLIFNIEVLDVNPKQ